MGTFINPNGDNGFIRLLKKRKSGLFVDKTDFIRITNSVLDEDGMLLAMTRPRRFGKSVMAGMLSAYYSKGYEGREIFSGLKISLKEKTDGKGAETDVKSSAANAEYEPDDSYKENLNKFDVIYIDMNHIRMLYTTFLDDNEPVAGVTSLVKYLEYAIIEELKSEERFSEILAQGRIKNTGIGKALGLLYEKLRAKFVFIMDEWDLIYRDYRDDLELQKQFLDLLRGLFKSEQSLQNFSLVYLTGILPIKKENSESALNNFDDYNMLIPGKYEEYFGFTDKEVQTLVKSSECGLSYQELKDWYDGYKLNGKEVYNPNSVIKAIRYEMCANYWSGASANRDASHLINLNYEGLKEDLILLLDGEQIKFNCASFQNDMKSFKSKDDVLALLVCLGYLGCVKADKGAEDNKEKNLNANANVKTVNSGVRIAYVPNLEIREALTNLINQENWFRINEIIRPSEELFDAICALNGQKTAEMIGKIHNSPNISLLGYNSEEALVYCVISALIWKTHGLYQIRREEQGGKGRADLIYEPNVGKPNLPILVIEFKNDHSAREAIDQIREKQYYSRYLDDGWSNDILLLGINYDSKTKEHECLIEKFERS